MRAGFLLPLLFCATLSAAEPVYGPGTKLDTLVVGSTTYRQVQIRSVNARTVIVTHAGGMASIPLRELSPEWQARFNYEPAAEAAARSASSANPPRCNRGSTCGPSFSNWSWA